MDREAPNANVSRAFALPQSARKSKKNFVRIISQNARGLKSDERLEELTTSMKARDIFAICLQETWRSDNETFDLNGYKFVLAGLKREIQSSRGSQGVGIVLGPKAIKAWKDGGCEVNIISARVIGLRMLLQDSRNQSFGAFLISAYAPVGVADESLWDQFFNDLDKCIAMKQPNDILLIGSDTNSSMGRNECRVNETKPSLGRFGLPYTNDAGRRFSSYLEIKDLLAITTCFQKPRYATWIHPRSKLEHQIDHFIVKKNKSCFFTNAGVTQSIIDSDHQAIICHLRLIVKLKKSNKPRQRLLQLDYNELKTDIVKDSFCSAVIKRYSDLPNTNSKYSRLASSVTFAAKQSLNRKAKPSPGWFNASKNKLLPLIQKRNELSAKNFKFRLRSTAKALKTSRKLLKRTVARAKKQLIVPVPHVEVQKVSGTTLRNLKPN